MWMRRSIFLVTALLLANQVAVRADWPCWRGEKRDAVCTETGLLKEWPAEGPALLWRMEGLGTGYSSVSIVNGTLFSMGDVPIQDDTRNDGNPVDRQCVLAIDLKTQKIAWKAEVGATHNDGSRCTPTVDDGLVYALGTSADLVCVSADTGKVVWRKNLESDFGGSMMSGWRWSESPLVDGDLLLCTPGAKDAAIVALNKKTGDVVWKTSIPALGDKGKDGAGYSSIVVSEACGVRQYVQLLGRGAIGVDAKTGAFLWGYNRVANGVANITTPVAHGDLVFVSTQYGTGSGLLKIVKDDTGFKADEICWLTDKEFQNHHGGVVLVDGHLYGGTNKNGGPPTCLEFATGKILWQKEAPAGGSAAYLYADGRFVVRYDSGSVTLVDATPTGHKVVSQFTPEKGPGPAWAHPVICDGKLYLRHRDILMCYDVKAK